MVWRGGRHQARTGTIILRSYPENSCHAAVKSWTGPCVFSMIFLVLNATVMCVKSWTVALELRTNHQTRFVHDFRCKKGASVVGLRPRIT
jgi:hypothetical protein